MLDLAQDDSDTEQLFRRFCDEALALGYDKIAYVNLAEHIDPDYDPRKRMTYTEEWIEHCLANDYLNADIIFGMARTNRHAISWELIHKNAGKTLSRLQHQILDDGFDAGHKSGTTIPFHGPLGMVAALSFATSGNKPDIAPLPLKLHGLAGQFHALYEAALNAPAFAAPPPKLPPGKWNASTGLPMARSAMRFPSSPD